MIASLQVASVLVATALIAAEKGSFGRICQVAPKYTVCFGPTRICPPNGDSIGSAVFAGLTVVTNRESH